MFVFRQAAQHTYETLDKFNARVRQLAKSCNFHEADREARSQIIKKCLLSKVVVLDQVAVPGGQQQATKHATLADAVD